MTPIESAQATKLEPGFPPAGQQTRVPAPFGRRRCTVTLNEPIGHYRLVGADDEDGPVPLPGQFYMLAAAEGWGEGSTQRPYLSRAFSVCRVRGSRLDFLVDAIGPGTSRLADLRPGEGLWLVGPLGNGFSHPSDLLPGNYGAGFAGDLQAGEPAGPAPQATPSPLLIGGGIGVAPLVIWQEALSEREIETRVVLGFRSAGYCETRSLFAGEAALATDDGSHGHHGLVTDLLARELEASDSQVVYACGPPRMLEAVRSLCVERSVPAELAMEEAMACGFGACFGCVVKTVDGYRRLCVDGPVVRAADLDDSWAG